MRLHHRSAGVVAVLLEGVLLAGCSYVNRVAARINPNGTLDFATCDARDADSFDVQWIYRDESNTPVAPVSSTPIIGEVEAGDVFHLDSSIPVDDWDSVYVASSASGDEAGLFGNFDSADLSSGDWVWNQTGIFIGTVDVKHCDLDEANAR
jgi:hypothetical protein